MGVILFYLGFLGFLLGWAFLLDWALGWLARWLTRLFRA